jgi:hypothetical protein
MKKQQHGDWTQRFAHVNGKTITFMEYVKNLDNDGSDHIYIRFADDFNLVVLLTPGIGVRAEWSKDDNGDAVPVPGKKRIFYPLWRPKRRKAVKK